MASHRQSGHRESERSMLNQERSVAYGARNPVKTGRVPHQQGRVLNPAGTKRMSVRQRTYDPATEAY